MVRQANGSSRAVAHLGERIRESRLSLGIGVRELARRVECSPSMISQIENGQANPSVSTLYAISSALGIPTDDLIAGSHGHLHPRANATTAPSNATTAPSNATTAPSTGRQAPSTEGRSHAEPAAGRTPARLQRVPVILHPEDRRVVTLERGVRWELLMPVPESNAEFMEVFYGVDGGSTAEEHAIRHNGREYSLILEGELSVQIGFERYVLEPGDSMAFDSTIPHRFWNAGAVPVRAIWFVQDRWPSADSL
jgi:transcriptional regulator with XRE-family HTH domain